MIEPLKEELDDDLLYGADLPDRDVEFTRIPSPPPSHHSSQDENIVIDNQDIARKRTARVLEYLAIQPPRNERNETKLGVINSDEIRQEFSYDSHSEESTFYYSRCKLKKAIRRDLIIKDLMKTETENRQNLPPLAHYNPANLPWLFRPYLMIMRLERVYQMLEGEPLEAITPEDILEQLLHMLQIYLGPMDEDSEHYKDILQELTLDWLSEIFKATEEESIIQDQLIKRKLSPSSPVTVKIAKMVKVHLKHLREAIKEFQESITDPATAFKSFGMDFYALPRPQHSIGIYRLRTKELVSLIEHKTIMEKDKEVEAMYNPALYDVGWNYFHKQVTLDMGRKKYLINPYTYPLLHHKLKKVTSRLLKMRALLLSSFPFGVEAAVYTKRVRSEFALLEKQPVFGELSDEEGIPKLSDIFFSQKMGNDQRSILFPGIFEGVIVTPDEMLRRIWKRIRAMLDIWPRVEMIELLPIYQKMFGHQFNISHWGFQNPQEFIEYSMKNLSDEIMDIELYNSTESTGVGVKCLRIRVKEVSCAADKHFGPGCCEHDDHQFKWKHLFENFTIHENSSTDVSSDGFYEVIRC